MLELVNWILSYFPQSTSWQSILVLHFSSNSILFNGIKGSLLLFIIRYNKEVNKMKLSLDQNKVLDLKEKSVFEDKYQCRKVWT